MIDALPQPDWLFHMGGGGVPIELLDPEAVYISGCHVAQRYMEPVLQQVLNYLDSAMRNKWNRS